MTEMKLKITDVEVELMEDLMEIIGYNTKEELISRALQTYADLNEIRYDYSDLFDGRRERGD